MEATGDGSVLIAVPGPDLAYTETRPAILQMASNTPKGSRMIEKPGYRSEYARTYLMQYFLTETEHEWLFLCDSDMRPEAETVLRLLERGKEAITGLYFYRGRPAFPCIRVDYDPYTIGSWPSAPYVDFPKDEVFKVGAVGFGALLLHRSTFARARPLFEAVGRALGLGGQLPWAYYGSYRGMTSGGDLVFSDLMKLAGVEFWCDSSVFVPHLTPEYLRLEEYDRDAAVKSMEEGKRA